MSWFSNRQAQADKDDERRAVPLMLDRFSLMSSNFWSEIAIHRLYFSFLVRVKAKGCHPWPFSHLIKLGLRMS